MQTTKSKTGGTVLINLAALVVVIAGMKTASALLVPFLLAIFVAILCAPPMFWLTQKRVPEALAVLIVFFAVLVVGVFIAAFIGGSINDFSSQLPFYQARLQEEGAALLVWLRTQGIDISQEVAFGYFDPSVAMGVIGNLLSGLGGMLTNTFLIILTVVFLLLEASGLPRKMHRALGDASTSLAGFEQFICSVKEYLSIKNSMSLLTGFSVAGLLFFLGVDYPLLWGMLAFLLNFVPNIGSVIAAVPAVLLALVQLGAGAAFWTALGYVMINVVVGNLLEPRFMSKGLGLSNLVVFVSLIFWGWILGPVGMLLSVPLTMIMKIALESDENTRWLGVLLGPDMPDPKPQNIEANAGD